jgi:hypothetical protein
MPAGALIIAVGLIAILWGGWWVPRQLRQEGGRVAPQGRERCAKFVTAVVMSRIRWTSAIVGGMCVLIGAVYLLLEL